MSDQGKLAVLPKEMVFSSFQSIDQAYNWPVAPITAFGMNLDASSLTDCGLRLFTARSQEDGLIYHEIHLANCGHSLLPFSMRALNFFRRARREVAEKWVKSLVPRSSDLHLWPRFSGSLTDGQTQVGVVDTNRANTQAKPEREV
jgi:hypothetical protein